jgi:hypothetical protein
MKSKDEEYIKGEEKDKKKIILLCPRMCCSEQRTYI